MGERTSFGEAARANPLQTSALTLLVGIAGSGGGVYTFMEGVLSREADAHRAHIVQLEEQLRVSQSAQRALRGQMCEYQRAAGHIMEDANCWGHNQ